MDETRCPQIDQRAAKIHREVHRAQVRDGVVRQILAQRRPVLSQKIDVKADAILLRFDLIAAEAVQIRAGRQLLQRLQLFAIVRDDLFVVFLRILRRTGCAGEQQRVHLLLRLRNGDVF